jgi:hypothetical protein
MIAVGCALESGTEPRDVETLQMVDGVYLNPETGEPYSGSVYGVGSIPTDSMGIPKGCGERFQSTLRDGKFHGSYSSHIDPFANTQGGVIIECGLVMPDSGEYRDGEKCGQWFENDRGPSGAIILMHVDSLAVTYDLC